MLQGVQTKIPAMVNCMFRPLRSGETPKRRGQTEVYECDGTFTEEFMKLRDSDQPWIPTIKHDGTCCMILNGNLYARLDVRPGKSIKDPESSLPSSDGSFRWIPQMGSTNAAYQYHRASLTILEDGVTAVRLVVPDQEQGYVIQLVPISELIGTYELVGPKIQNNPYRFPEELVPVEVLSKGQVTTRKIPAHYLVRHGSFPIKVTDELFENYEKLRAYILDHQYEGVVIHGPSGPLFKFNRGHMNAESSEFRIV